MSSRLILRRQAEIRTVAITQITRAAYRVLGMPDAGIDMGELPEHLVADLIAQPASVVDEVQRAWAEGTGEITQPEDYYGPASGWAQICSSLTAARMARAEDLEGEAQELMALISQGVTPDQLAFVASVLKRSETIAPGSTSRLAGAMIAGIGWVRRHGFVSGKPVADATRIVARLVADGRWQVPRGLSTPRAHFAHN